MRTLACLAVSSLIWVLVLGQWYRPDPSKVLDHQQVSTEAHLLAHRQIALFQHDDPSTALNPEWALMTRAFVAWGFANLALREPQRKPELLPIIDKIIATTEADEARGGAPAFLLGYGRNMQTSLFVDSEIALMLGLRRMVEDRPDYKARMHQRLDAMAARMSTNPLHSDPSYPDDCWTFDHSVALAAMKAGDVLDGTDHSALIRGWLDAAKQRLTDRDTGMLVSDYNLSGRFRDGPEGSSIWLSATMLRVVDEPFARAQYQLAKKHLAHSIAGFGLAREWPQGVHGHTDIDSGIQLPLVEASPSSSGFALVAAATFEDKELLTRLLASLDYAGFPERDATGLTYSAGNEMGDAVLLYALTQGPAWDRLSSKQLIEEARR
jgi:hypothetical protein